MTNTYHNPSRPNGFTLVELLVVVAIIVVLLALLAPALDKALDEAMLAVCMSKLDGMHTAMSLYVLDHKFRLPNHRSGHDEQGNAADPGTPQEVWWGSELLKYGQVPESFHCPNLGDGQVDYGHTWSWNFDQHNVGYGYNAYFLGIGPLDPAAWGGYANRAMKVSNIIAPSECFLFGESNPIPGAGVWSQSMFAPTASDQGTSHEGLNDARHGRGGVVAFNDGSARAFRRPDFNPQKPQWDFADANMKRYWDPLRRIPG